MTDFRQLCRDLMDALDSGIPGARIQSSPLAERARAALARWGSTPSPTTPMTDPMDDLRQASADVSGVEVLSPAAQAVLDGVCDNTEPDCDIQHLIAAALRAAAEHCVPDDSEGYWVYIPRVLAIADELEGT